MNLLKRKKNNNRASTPTSRSVEFDAEFVQIVAEQCHFMLRLDELDHISVHSGRRKKNIRANDKFGIYF